LPSQTKVSKTVINAYNIAHYHVKVPDQPFVLLIERRSAPLAALMKDLGVTQAAFITASNPFSRKVKDTVNERAHKALRNDIEKLGVVFYEGTGEDPSGKWKVEASYLVLGITPEQAKALGVKYGQNALVWIESDAIPELMLLR
jgi:hypothetical protein